MSELSNEILLLYTQTHTQTHTMHTHKYQNGNVSLIWLTLIKLDVNLVDKLNTFSTTNGDGNDNDDA